MKINPREWKWTNEGPYDEWMDNFDKGLLTVLSFLIIPLVLLLIVAGLDGLTGAPDALSWAFWGVASFVLSLHIYWVPRVNKLHGVTDDSAKSLGQKYLNLSKKDRKEFFPANFVKVLNAVGHMEYDERRDFISHGNAIIRDINRRDSIITKAEAKAKVERTVTPDFNNVLEQMRQGREHAAIEANTMEEYL